MPRSVIFYRNSALGRMSPLVAAAKIGNVQEVLRSVQLYYKNIGALTYPLHVIMSALPHINSKMIYIEQSRICKVLYFISFYLK